MEMEPPPPPAFCHRLHRAHDGEGTSRCTDGLAGPIGMTEPPVSSQARGLLLRHTTLQQLPVALLLHAELAPLFRGTVLRLVHPGHSGHLDASSPLVAAHGVGARKVGAAVVGVVSRRGPRVASCRRQNKNAPFEFRGNSGGQPVWEQQFRLPGNEGCHKRGSNRPPTKRTG